MLTVVIATHNGARTLPRVLDAYTRLDTVEGGWKLVIVDNASNDETEGIIKAFAPKLPVTYLFEPRRGKNVALNSAIASFEGDLVVFSDDDAIPQSTWLKRLKDCADENTDFDIFGGAIRPMWEVEPPDWVHRLVPPGLTYAITDSNLANGPISPGLIWGANMAIRLRAFNEGHRFNERVGPKGNNYVMGSETEFTIRIRKYGYKSWFCPDSIVYHFIRSYQLEKKWIFGRAYRSGRGAFQREQNTLKPEIPKLFGAPRWMVRKLINEGLVAVAARIIGNSDRNFLARWEMSFILGYLSEAMR